KQTADEKADADCESNGNPQLRWDEIVLERIFHEERHAEEKREAADPREQFRAHELLPVNRRSGRSCDSRNSCFDEFFWNWRRHRFFLWHGCSRCCNRKSWRDR